jgi:hypothetical protein
MSAEPIHSTDSDPNELNLVNRPDAARLIQGLRDTGYDLNTAAADIIDNSIAANATDVNIEVLLYEDGRKFVYFGDNGEGMDKNQLWDAMRYGAPKRPSAKSLGKFGLGLKTASSACCRKFTVISKTKDAESHSKLAWDLEHVEKLNEWQMLKEDITADEQEKFDELCGDQGTLVIWSRCDRLLNKTYTIPGGIHEQKALSNRTENLRKHVAKIFHKFLDPTFEEFQNVTIRINGAEIAPWNPFYPEKSEQVLAEPETTLEIECEDGTIRKATLRAWILPHSKDLTDEENDKALISSRRQGFYIYREGRMIYDCGWLGIFRSDDPHLSLFRAEFCFDHDLDHAFQVPVDKSKVTFDPALEEELKNRLKGPWNEADRRYRRKESAIVTKTNLDHASSNKSIEKAKGRTKKPAVTNADPTSGEATLTNNLGNVTIKAPIQNNVSIANLYIEEVEDIHTGHLWEPSLRSTGTNNHITGVRLNKHHPFYPKVYLKGASNGYTVEGIDFLLWALSTAEFNNSNEELKPIFSDLREEVSSNLRKLLENTPMPDDKDLSEIETSSTNCELE